MQLTTEQGDNCVLSASRGRGGPPSALCPRFEQRNQRHNVCKVKEESISTQLSRDNDDDDDKENKKNKNKKWYRYFLLGLT